MKRSTSLVTCLLVVCGASCGSNQAGEIGVPGCFIAGDWSSDELYVAECVGSQRAYFIDLANRATREPSWLKSGSGVARRSNTLAYGSPFGPSSGPVISLET